MMSLPAFLISLLPLIVVVLAVLAGLVLLVRGIRGEADLSFPTCAKCRYDLRGRDLTAVDACPECGTPLTAPRAVLYGTYRRRPRMAMLGIALVLCPVLSIVTLQYVLYHRARQASLAQAAAMGRMVAGNFSNQTTQQLLAMLPQQIGDPAVWGELTERLLSGTLQDDDIAVAINHLIDHLDSDGSPGPAGWAQGFLTTVISDRRVNAEQLTRLVEAYYKRDFTIQIRKSIRSTALAAFTIRQSHRPELPGLTTIAAVNHVTLDGRSLDVCNPYAPGAPVSVYGSNPLNGQIKVDAEPGKRQLEFCVGVSVLEGKHRVYGTNGGQLPPALHRWSATMTVDVEVLPEDASLIAQRNDPDLEKEIRRSIRVRELRLSPAGSSVRADLFLTFSENSPVLLSFDVFVRYGAREERLGYFNAGQPLNPRTRSGPPLFIANLPAFPESIDQVDVVLRPNVLAVERMHNLHEIWGEEIVYENIPVVRE